MKRSCGRPAPCVQVKPLLLWNLFCHFNREARNYWMQCPNCFGSDPKRIIRILVRSFNSQAIGICSKHISYLSYVLINYKILNLYSTFFNMGSLDISYLDMALCTQMRAAKAQIVSTPAWAHHAYKTLGRRATQNVLIFLPHHSAFSIPSL